MTQPTPTTQSSSAAAPSVAWLVAQAKVSDDARPLAESAADGGALVQALTANGKPTEAVKVIAAALPPREGVWWAWVSARHAAQFGTPGGAPTPAVTEALEAIEHWISNPDDDRRRAAWAAGERAGFESPAGCAAAAVFFTAGSVAPAGVMPVPPPAGIDRMLVGNAVALAAAANPDLFEALAGAYIAQGLEVVKQLGGWEKSVAMSREHFQSQHERHVRETMPPSEAAPNQRAGP